MKKFIFAFFVALFPYVPILLGSFHVSAEWMLLGTGIALLLALAASILYLVTSIRTPWEGETTALIGMVVKLIHIPAYLLVFMLGASGVMFIHFFAVTVVAFFFDCILIALSGILSLSATIRLWREGKIKIVPMVAYSITSFLFCVDIISAGILYIKGKKRRM